MTQPVLLSRRRFLATASFAATASLLPRKVFAQDAAQPPMVLQMRAQAATTKVTVQPLRGRVSALQGAGGNMAVLAGKDGALLVDSQFATSKPHIQEALASLSAGAPKHLINTHWHYDHTDGNAWMHEAGATILAHANTRVRLSRPQFIPAMQVTFPVAPAAAIPTEIFLDEHTVRLNGSLLKLAHYDPAHTDTDISVYFTEADVLHTGDTWFNHMYPYIDYATGGSLHGMIRATERNLAMTTDKTIIIPGHGEVGNKKQLAEFRDMLLASRDTVGKLKQQGKTLAEVTAARPLSAYDSDWAKGFTTPEIWLTLVYQDV